MRTGTTSRMRNSFLAIFTLFLLASIPAAANANLVVQFKGTNPPLSTVELMDLLERPGLQGLDPDVVDDIMDTAICVPVAAYNPASGLRVGYGVDCLDDITALDSGIITLRATTFFHFFNSGWLVIQGDTTVAPLSTDHDPSVTHSTGAIGTGNNVVHGSGKFAEATGNIRLSGLVNLTEFPDTMGFDCLWVLDLDY